MSQDKTECTGTPSIQKRNNSKPKTLVCSCLCNQRSCYGAKILRKAARGKPVNKTGEKLGQRFWKPISLKNLVKIRISFASCQGVSLPNKRNTRSWYHMILTTLTATWWNVNSLSSLKTDVWIGSRTSISLRVIIQNSKEIQLTHQGYGHSGNSDLYWRC